MALDLITFGEFYRDLIFCGLRRLPRLGEEIKNARFAQRPGGGAAITALAAQRAGLRAGIVTVVGERRDLAPLRLAGVDTRGAVQDPRRRTPLTVAVSTSRDRYFLTYSGANASFESFFRYRDLLARLRTARHVHFCFQPRRMEELRRLVCDLESAGVGTSLDVGWSPGLARNPSFRRLLAAVALFFPNLAEARQITGQHNAHQATRGLARLTRQPIVKLGSRGALAWDGDSVLHSPAPRVKVVDSTGAGDVFNGAFLAGRLRGQDLAECLRSANRCAARSVTVAGGWLPADLQP
jgi:sugar/nucleoside kinase (ribokinase family)